MRPKKMYVPKDKSELLDFLSAMLLSAPKFIDKTGYFPYQDLDYVFRQLNEGLSLNRLTFGEERYNQLKQMSGQMRALFEADPEDKTGDTLKGCKSIHAMEEILLQFRSKA